MRTLIYVYSLFFLVPIFNLKASNYNSYQLEVKGIEYRIDPRIELYNIIAMQFGHNGMSLSNITYKKENLDYFQKMQDHEAPPLLLESFKNGWGVDDPIFFMLHLGDNFGIKENMPKDIIERGGGMQHMVKLSDAIKDYALKADFQNYFNEVQKQFYHQVLAQTRYNFRNFDGKEILEDFFQEEANSYTVILNLMGGYGNFGKSISNESGFDCYAVVETSASSGDIPVFYPSIATTDLILHEFAHGFVNPKVDELKAEFEKFDGLYQPIENSMKSQGYWHWHAVLNEHLVRASVIEMIKNNYGEEIAENTYYRKEMGRRFIYLDAIRKEFSDHRNQDGFDFESVIKDLPELLAQIDESYIHEKMNKVIELRKPDSENIPKPWEFSRDSSTVFIVSSHEKDLTGQKKMIDFVKTYRDMFSQEIQIITDEEALKADLFSKDLVVFGTKEGNSFLKKYFGKLPISIDKDRIVTNKVIPGKHLQLVTSWVSPINSEKSFIIYTGQQVKDIVDFYKSPVKDQYHYWVAKNTITLDKGNYSRLGLIWLPEIF